MGEPIVLMDLVLMALLAGRNPWAVLCVTKHKHVKAALLLLHQHGLARYIFPRGWVAT